MLRFVLLLLLFSTPAQAADIWVTHLTDDTDTANGTCNLREAITAANTNAAVDACPAGQSFNTDEIYFAKTGLINLIQALPPVNYDLNINGPGAEFLTIDANGFGRVFNFDDIFSGGPQDFRLSGVTITGGETTTSGGGIFQAFNTGTLTVSDAVITGNMAANGGGISGGGTLTLERVTITGNMATARGGGISMSVSGDPSLILQESTISGNTAGANGGGLYAGSASVTIRRSTFSGNSADDTGGGIYFSGSGDHTFDIRYTTVTNNTAGADLTGFNSGGGIFANSFLDNEATMHMQSNIVAGNFDLDETKTPDISISNFIVFTSHGYNLIGINAFQTTFFPTGNPNANADYAGTEAAPLVANLNPLANIGGPTEVHPPTIAITPNTVIDLGSCPAEKHDQRGAAGNTAIPLRIQNQVSIPDADDGCDIGAVESSGTIIPSAFDLKVLLDGPYTNVLMHTDLNAAGQIPLAHPYNTAPWNYGGQENVTAIPTDMVDWVYVEFLQGAPMDPGGPILKFRKVYYLEDNGDLSVPDMGFLAPKIDPGQYYIAIYHRNHLPILSAKPVYVEWHEVVGTYDFRTALSKAYTAGGTAMRDRGGLFTMWGGDGDANSSVTAFDFLNEWLPINGGPPGYNGGDFDMNGSGTAFDFLTIWLPANGQATQVP